MKLSVLLKSVSTVAFSSFSDAEIKGITADSRRSGDGVIFVAIKGARADGNDFIADAYRMGCRVFVTENRSLKIECATCIYTENSRKTLAELCAAFFGNPEKRMLFVGITGTKGKTTTSVILSRILSGAGIKNMVIGTLGAISDGLTKTENTTPDPEVIFPLLKKAVLSGVEVAVIEVSSQALKDYRVYGITFEYVAFTGIGRDHVGAFEHPTFIDYVYSKRRLFSDYGAVCAVVNFDDPFSTYISSDVREVIKCGFSESDGYVIKNFSDSALGSEFFLNGVHVKTSLPGEYNAKNTTIAMALACAICGISVSESSRYVKDVRVEGRFDMRVVGGKNVIVDYAHNAESFREIIALCRRLFCGRIICVFGSVGGRSHARRGELACVTEERADFSVITSDNPREEYPLAICADIYDAFKDKAKAKIIVSREEAIKYAVEEAAFGDTVLVLGRGHERVMNIGGMKVPFSDCAVVDEICSQMRNL